MDRITKRNAKDNLIEGGLKSEESFKVFDKYIGRKTFHTIHQIAPLKGAHRARPGCSPCQAWVLTMIHLLRIPTSKEKSTTKACYQCSKIRQKCDREYCVHTASITAGSVC